MSYTPVVTSDDISVVISIMIYEVVAAGTISQRRILKSLYNLTKATSEVLKPIITSTSSFIVDLVEMVCGDFSHYLGQWI